MKTAGLIFALCLVTALVAEAIGKRLEIYTGAAGGLLMGGMGYLFAARIASNLSSKGAAQNGRWDIWAIWGAGMLARLALLGVLTVLYRWFWGPEVAYSLVTAMAVYLVLLFWETAWLFGTLKQGGKGTE